MSQLRKYRGLVTLALVAVLVLALLWMLAVPSQTQTAEHPLSAFEPGPHGLRALYLLGRRMNLNVRLGTTSPDLLSGAGTIVIGAEGHTAGAPLPAPLQIDENDIWTLLDRGMHVLYLSPVETLPNAPGGKAPASHKSQSAVEEPSNDPAARSSEASSQPDSLGKEATTVSEQIPFEMAEDGTVTFRVGNIDSPFFASARTLEAPGFDLGGESRWKLWKRLAGSAQQVYWLGETGKPFLAVYQASRGKLVALFVSEVLINDNIARADNVVFAYNLLQQVDSPLGTYFLESIHGHYRSSVGLTNLLVFTSWGHLIILAAIAVLMSLMAQVFPLGRKRATHREQFPSPIERVRAQAQLWRRSGMFVPAMHFALDCSCPGKAGTDETTRSLSRVLTAAGISRQHIHEIEQAMAGQHKLGATARKEMIRAYGVALRKRGHQQTRI